MKGSALRKTDQRGQAGVSFSPDRLNRMVTRAWLCRWRCPELSMKHATHAHEEAARLSPEDGAHLVGRAAKVMGWHERWLGNFMRARTHFLQAEDLLQHADFAQQRVEAMAGRAVGLYSQGRQDEASELIREALRILGPAGQPSTRVDLFVVQSTIVSYSGAFEDALELIDHAIAIATEAGAVAELSHAVHIRARILLRKGDVDAARAPAEDALELAKRARNAVVLPYALEVVATVHLEQGNNEKAVELGLRAVDLGERRSDRRVTCQALQVIGKAQRRLGKTADALTMQRRGLAIATEIAYPLWQRWFQLEIANILESKEDFEGALTAYKAYAELDQALFRKETETRMAEMRTKFDLQRAQEMAETERARSEELAAAREVAELAARTDRLTGVANREGLDAYVRAGDLLTSDRPFAYVVVDLDRFKPVNDTFGHATGDAVLTDVAHRLAAIVRQGDLVARIGGDEFAIIVQDVASRDRAGQLGERLLRAFDDPVLFSGRKIDVAASIGIATSAVIGRDLDALKSAADQAMYASKKWPNGGFTIYSADQVGAAPNLNQMEAIREAIHAGDIQPWYQPKIDLRTGRVLGFETLARWVKQDGRVQSAGEFLPQIMTHHLQTEFTFSILRQGLRQLSYWSELDMPTPGLAINMIEEVLASHEACSDIELMLQEYAPLWPHITFEITEDVFFDRAAQEIQQSIQRLGAAGIRFAMDDFGTGYGSFLHLHQLKVDELKIDIEFVRGIGVDRSAEVIIEGFVAIANGLGVDVTAEGIETDEQAAFLIDRGCDVGQGYLFSPALSADRATAYLTKEWLPRRAEPDSA